MLAVWLDTIKARPSGFFHAFVNVAAPRLHHNTISVPKLPAEIVANIGCGS